MQMPKEGGFKSFDPGDLQENYHKISRENFAYASDPPISICEVERSLIDLCRMKPPLALKEVDPSLATIFIKALKTFSAVHVRLPSRRRN